jgi:hypothetical protein
MKVPTSYVQPACKEEKGDAPSLTSVTPTLSVICPMHDEEASLPTFFGRLLPALEATGETFEIVCISKEPPSKLVGSLLPSTRIYKIHRN